MKILNIRNIISKKINQIISASRAKLTDNVIINEIEYLAENTTKSLLGHFNKTGDVLTNIQNSMLDNILDNIDNIYR